MPIAFGAVYSRPNAEATSIPATLSQPSALGGEILEKVFRGLGNTAGRGMLRSEHNCTDGTRGTQIKLDEPEK